MTTNHPAHGPASLDRLYQIREILSKAAAQSDGGNLGYAIADAVKVIDVAIAAFGAKLDENGLLPCPLCGGGAEFDYDDDNLNWISCSACGISTDTVYHTDIDARDKLREVWNRRAAMLQAGNSPVTPDGWKVEAEQLAEIHGCSFVVFRHGEEPQCADPTKVILSFSDEGLGHHSAAPQQEVNRG